MPLDDVPEELLAVVRQDDDDETHDERDDLDGVVSSHSYGEDDDMKDVKNVRRSSEEGMSQKKTFES